jgi:glycosyltransferase involved in cell wall biosynthesis
MNKNFKQPIKIANIIEEGRLGGPQTRMALVASQLSKLIDITFIFPKKDSKEFQMRCDLDNIKYFLFPFTAIRRNWFAILKYVFLFPFEVFMLFNYLKKNSFDIVHVSGGSRQIKGIIAAKLAKIKVIWELNDTYAPLFIRIIFYLISPLADSIVFASNRTQNYYNLKTIKKCFLIQSPVDTNLYNPNLDYPIEDFLNSLIQKKKIIIGTVANISPVKGLIFFLEVVKNLISYSNKVTFLIVGSVHNSQKKFYYNLLKIINKMGIKNIYFLGARSDIRPILKIIDIYLCTSKNESSPLSIWEAMSMEKAIVSTDVGDVSNFITNNESGFVIQEGDEATLTKHLIKLIKEPELRKNLGISARKIAKNNLDLKICTNLHLKMYETILDNDYK